MSDDLRMVKASFERHTQAVKKAESLIGILVTASQKISEVLLAGGKVLMMGNGGSAADAQHFAAELVVRYKKERAAYAAIALSTDTSAITAVGNDLSFDQIFSRQVEALGRTGDVVVAFSTSGHSRNIVEGVLEAKKQGLFTIGFLGRDGGSLKGLVDLPLVVEDEETARVQEVHGLMYHIICELFEDQL